MVNHGERESIEELELIDTPSGYRAVWRGCVTNRDGLFNDVAATGDGGFIATVMMSKAAWDRSDLLDIMVSGVDTGYLVEWHPGGRLTRLPNSEAPIANGMQLITDRRFIYYAAWSGKQIRKYDRHAGHVVETANVPFYPDNIISVRADGTLIEPRIKGNVLVTEGQGPIAAARLRKIFTGKIIAAGGFEPDTAEAAVRDGDADLVAFGRHFVANPDLPKRIRLGLPLNAHDRHTFYTFDARGYTDYPFQEQRSASLASTR